eukprot:3934019-Rhodomonas_salina.2
MIPRDGINSEVGFTAFNHLPAFTQGESAVLHGDTKRWLSMTLGVGGSGQDLVSWLSSSALLSEYHDPEWDATRLNMLAGSAVCWLVLPVDADVKHENRMINVKQHQTKRRQPMIRGTERIGAEYTRTLLRILAILPIGCLEDRAGKKQNGNVQLSGSKPEARTPFGL